MGAGQLLVWSRGAQQSSLSVFCIRRSCLSQQACNSVFRADLPSCYGLRTVLPSGGKEKKIITMIIIIIIIIMRDSCRAVMILLVSRRKCRISGVHRGTGRTRARSNEGDARRELAEPREFNSKDSVPITGQHDRI